MKALAKLTSRHPKSVLAVTAVLFVVGAIFGGPVATLLSTGSSDFQDPAAETIAAQDAIRAATGNDGEAGVVALVKLPANPEKNKAAAKQLAAVQKQIEDTDGTDHVVGYSTTGSDAFIAKDGSAAYVGAALLGNQERREGTVDDLKAEFEDNSNVKLGGRSVVFPDIGAQVSSDLVRAELIAFPILFLLSLWVFRGFIAALLPLFVGGLTIVTTFLTLRGVNEIEPLSVFAANLVTGLGLGLAIDYSLFIVSRYREEIAKSGPGEEAMLRVMQTAGKTVMFSSLTVAAALASLLVFPLRFLSSMGVGGALTAIIGAAAALISLPALLTVLGTRVNSLSPKRWQAAVARDASHESQGFWYRWSKGVMRRPGLVALGAAGLMIVLGLPFLQIQFNAADATALPTSNHGRQVSESLDKNFPPGESEGIDVVVQAPKNAGPKLAAYRKELAQQKGAIGVSEAKHLGSNTWEIVVATAGSATSSTNAELAKTVRALDSPYPVLVGGEAAFFVDESNAIADRLPIAAAILVFTTILILFLMTGSVILPLKALIMNLLTLTAAFGILVFIFQDGRLEGFLNYTSNGGIEVTQPVLLFAIAFGLSTDYGVFLLSRIKEARDGGADDRESVAVGLQRTGRIVTAAALLFCVAIGAFATSDVLFIKQVGIGTALAVAIDATLVRALLVPSLMALLGKWNWWAPKPLRKLHERIGLAEG